MSAPRLLLLFAAALAVALAAFAPLGLALEAAGAARLGLSARQASGSVWSGRLEGAALGGTVLGDLRAGLEPLSPLFGGARLWFRGEGPIRLRGALRAGRGGVGLSGVTADLPLQALAPQLPFAGRLGLSDVDVEFARGACRRASGRLTLEQLRLGPGLPGAEPLTLQGAPACRDGHLAALLSGQHQGVAVDAAVQIQADGRYRVDTRVRIANPTFETAAALGGFHRRTDGFVRTDRGRLGGA